MRRNLLFIRILLIFVSFGLISCGPSPLFNYKKENEQEFSAPQMDGSPQQKGEVLECTFDWGDNECWSLQWELGPQLRNESRFTVTLLDKESRLPLESTQEPQFDLWMPDMNHGSSPIKVQKISASKYYASKVYFIMRGHWVLRLKLDKKILSQIAVEIP